ncbi:MAG: hypothetical protein AAGD96_31565, partial [Chloroflexota bacterium]
MDLRFGTKRAYTLALIFFAALLFSSAIAETAITTAPESTPQINPPTITNGSFESESVGNNHTSLTGWTFTNGSVDVLSSQENKLNIDIGPSDGDRFINLANASIEQQVSGFIPDQPYVLRIDYWGYHGFDGPLWDAQILVDGVPLSQGLFGGDHPGIHNKEEHDWIVCNGFQFTPSSSSVKIEIQSEETGQNGLLIDNIRIEEGEITQPSKHAFDTLIVDSDGWSRLENWSFEESVASLSSPENTGPNSTNPHLCGDSIPGWRVTRENTDWLEDSSPNQDTWHPQDGSRVMDVGGHGPGGIAQTISGLAPNGTYTLEFYAARHRFWGSEDMITDLWSNGDLKLKVVRTTDQ